MLSLVSSRCTVDPRLYMVSHSASIFSEPLFDFLVQQMHERNGNPDVLDLICKLIERVYEPPRRTPVPVTFHVVERWRDELTDREAAEICEQLSQTVPGLDMRLAVLCVRLRGHFELIEKHDAKIIVMKRHASGIQDRTVRFGRMFLQALAMLEGLVRDPERVH